MVAATLPQRMAGVTRAVGASPQLLVRAVFLLLLTGCHQKPAPAASATDKPSSSNTPIPTSTNSASASPALPIYSYDVIHVWPHDRTAFTQGLVFLDGQLLESTGVNGQSSLRRVELETGRVLQQIKLPYEYFAEGLVVFGRKLFQLTWLNGKCFVYDRDTFRKQSEFTYPGEGWGLTTDGQWLIMSDGTERLRFLDPDSFQIKRTIQVAAGGRPVNRLNELEYIRGEIFANIWQSDFVARIDPANGNVLGLINFTGLLGPSARDASTDVFNGIAYDSTGDRIFVTGKRWPSLFEVRLKAK